MNQTARSIIDAIIQKAENCCPDSLAMIGLYGSMATGDVHEKSDLDLLILIRDDAGWQLAEGFILRDSGIGYDLYCTTWGMLEADAQCNHAHLSKLLDSPLVYVKDPEDLSRLEQLRKSARALLASDARYEKARGAYETAKSMYADCFLTESMAQIRTQAGGAIHYLMDAVMLAHGQYFRKGVKRAFDELNALNLPFDMEGAVMAVIRSETPETLRAKLTELMGRVRECIRPVREKAAPSRENLAGTYEEMVSNWRSKMQEAADRKDMFSSFMNMVSLRFMMREIGENIAVADWDLLEQFDPYHLERNAAACDTALEKYLEEYRKAGIQPKFYENLQDFLTGYLATAPK